MTAFILPEVWPAQRANRKRMSEADKQYRARVRANKRKAESKRRSAERSARAAQRKRNREIIARNAQQDAKTGRQKDGQSRQAKAAETRRFEAIQKINGYNQS